MKNTKTLRQFILERIEVKTKERHDFSRTLDNRISIGGQLTVLKQVLNFIDSHEDEREYRLFAHNRIADTYIGVFRNQEEAYDFIKRNNIQGYSLGPVIQGLPTNK